LHYQPVVDLDRSDVTGVEALVRWAHPRGLRMPDSFIPLAESSGLIVPLGAWVVHEACRQAAAWSSEGFDLDVAVNLSTGQLRGHDIVDVISEALNRASLNPSRLMVEVTESAVMEDTAVARLALEGVKSLGCRVAVDDFGTGYSSLLYLKRYPVNALKIDRSFVAGLGIDAVDDAIVSSVIGLARAVGAISIAEGVETPAQLAALRDLGCGFAQGYLLARPVSAPEIPLAVAATMQVLACDEPSPRWPRRSVAAPAVVARISQLERSGASLHTIAAVLNREHAVNPRGVRWHSATVGQAATGRAIRRAHTVD
jgi:EAL domain-containing protein (putative c-di-GMP-specific phosphodiesterase class I)